MITNMQTTNKPICRLLVVCQKFSFMLVEWDSLAWVVLTHPIEILVDGHTGLEIDCSIPNDISGKGLAMGPMKLKYSV